MAANDTTMPPSRGTHPPERPVAPPRAVSGIRCSRASFTIAATSPAEAGVTTADGTAGTEASPSSVVSSAGAAGPAMTAASPTTPDSRLKRSGALIDGRLRPGAPYDAARWLRYPSRRHCFAGLFDDAALFPPGNAPMAQAVSGHLGLEQSPLGLLVGPFVCLDTRTPELVGEIRRESRLSPLPVSAVVSGGPFSVEAVFSDLAEEPDIGLVALEVPLGPGDGAPGRAAAAAACLAELPPGVAGYVEVPRGDELEAVLDVLAEHRVRAKLRTGGPSPLSFPADGEVAAFIHGCTARDLAFKCTAGLHAGVRHAVPVGEAGGVMEQQGFLNIILATSASLAGAGRAEITAVLAEQDEALVAKAVAGLGPQQVEGARGFFRSFGTCSVSEPVADLVRLGLLGSGF